MPYVTGPLFSIVLPTFERPALLACALASVSAQTVRDFELIVVDDGSRVAPVLPQGGTVRLVRHERNLGAAAARNAGIRVARGRYVAFLDDDDEYLPTFLAATRDALAAAPPSVGLTWCGVRLVPDGGAGGAADRPAPAVREPRSLAGRLLWAGAGCGLTLTAACLDAVGGFDPSLETVEDSDLFLRVLGRGFAPRRVPGTHVVVHEHAGPRLSDVSRHPTRIRECRLLLERHAALLRRRPALAAQLARHAVILEEELRQAAAS